jgi:DNA-binding IclR family transcriptional regulator
MAIDRPPDRRTALDRPPEEAAEDTSFARGLKVLITVADRGEVRADELSTLLEIPVSTVYRYLRTLAAFGFVERHDGGYRLGPRVTIGSGALVTAETLLRAAGPALHRLVEESGETAAIMRRVGTSAMCLAQVESPQPLRVALSPGAALPLHAGAPAKVLLAYAPEEILEEVIGLGLEPLTRSTPDAARLRADLEAILRTGAARSDGESIAGSTSIAVPILAADGIVGSMCLVAPSSRVTEAWARRAERLLRDAARAVEGALRG